MKLKKYRVLGLMTGTSIDGIDVALIETDGLGYVKPLAFMPNPYDFEFRKKLRRYLGNPRGREDLDVCAFEHELTELHAEIVSRFRQKYPDLCEKIDLVGFHGQTIWHNPKQRRTIQLGDGALLARMINIPVINDFRAADILAGGQGAPLVPLYHRALSLDLPKPLAIFNIGGVSNVTWVGGEHDDQILAFDVGPGNALIDDWVLRHTGEPYDEYGLLAAGGHIDVELVETAMANKFFKKRPPKSLDRDEFKHLVPEDISVADGAATLTKITCCGIVESLKFMPQLPQQIYVAGGGRLNTTMMRWIAELSNIPANPVDILGWSGDGLEAEAFAYLAVRSRLGLALSVPGTTGVPEPLTGGAYHTP